MSNTLQGLALIGGQPVRGNGATFQLNPFEALPNVPVRIFQLSEEANPEGFTKAWGLSLVLIVIILAGAIYTSVSKYARRLDPAERERQERGRP